MFLSLITDHGLLDLQVDWTALGLGFIATVGSTFAAVTSTKTNRRIKTNSGKTIGQHVEGLGAEVARTAKEVAKTLEEARIVREHEAVEAALRAAEHTLRMNELEQSKLRVAAELAALTELRLSFPIFSIKEKEKDD